MNGSVARAKLLCISAEAVEELITAVNHGVKKLGCKLNY